MFIRFTEIDEETVRARLAEGFESAIGHQDTADLLTERLGVPIPANRINVSLVPGEEAILAQLTLPRTRQENGLYSREQVMAAPLRFLRVQVLSPQGDDAGIGSSPTRDV